MTNQRGFVPVLILLIGVLIGAAVVLGYNSGLFRNVLPTQKTPDGATPTPSPTSCDFSFIKHTKDSQGGLTTTTDTKNEFQITYPSSWEWEVQQCNGFSYMENEKLNSNAKVWVDESENFGFYSDGKTAEEVIKKEYKPGRERLPKVEEKQITIGNYSAKRVFEQMLKGESFPQPDTSVTGLTYLIAKNNKVYKFSFQIQGDNYSTRIKEIDNFIQTFK